MKGMPQLQADGTITWVSECGLCEQPSQVAGLDADTVAAWLGGRLVQEAFPGLSDNDREILATGTHGTCFFEDFYYSEICQDETATCWFPEDEDPF